VIAATNQSRTKSGALQLLCFYRADAQNGRNDLRNSRLEKLNRPGQLIIANHPTLVDIVFLISRVKQANCIVKQKLWHNPFMRGPILNAGYISNGDP